MYPEWLEKADHLPGVIQGALGSFLFWLLLQLVQFIGLQFLRAAGKTTETLGRRRKFREYIYRRYTSMSGLVNYTQGYLFSLSRALRGLLAGLIFCSIALLLGGGSHVIWGICFGAAIFYFGSALTWLVPSSDWKSASAREHWKRVVDLEKELFGEVAPETHMYIDKLTPEERGEDKTHSGGSERPPGDKGEAT